MKNSAYFSNPRTLEELKKQYRELAMKHHSDKGGDTETMKKSMQNMTIYLRNSKTYIKPKTAKPTQRNRPQQKLPNISRKS
ncbi:MAG: hypothetical protein FWH10_01570 [Oscillospiraceae bacterium]|nr:hypothetical protein [Oscillospiraceae bacterium]